MTNCRPIWNLLASKEITTTNSNDSFYNPTLYHQLVGALQYITITPPDLSLPVNRLSQNMHRLLNIHFQQLKRTHRYLRATSSHGLLIRPENLTITTFSNSEWADDQSDRKSTFGYCILLGFVPIFWATKKQTNSGSLLNKSGV